MASAFQHPDKGPQIPPSIQTYISQESGPEEANYDFDLGSHSRKITTTSDVAQTWFNRGLVWNFGFNHEESAACFGRAIKSDPNCAMAYWGLAYTLGPNYNKPWELFDGAELAEILHQAHDAAVAAKELCVASTPAERALIETLQYRYPSELPKSEDFSRWNREYADAMEKVHKEFPEDLDVATLFAEAMMQLTPWKLWDLRTGEPAPGARTLEIKRVMESVFTQDAAWQHPGLLHLAIHLFEMSSRPEDGLPYANALRNLVPDAGHLRHMPSHIDVLCGDYDRAISSNSAAIAADEKYFSRSSAEKFYALYRSHDLHFRIYAAMLAARSKVALDTVQMLEDRLASDDLMRVQSPPMADWLEGFLGMRVHALIRFGRWQDILDLPFPTDSTLYCVTTAMLHYGKGVALAATGRISEALSQQALFDSAVTRVPETRTIFNNTCLDILSVASAMLTGEIEYRRKHYAAAFAALRESIRRDDELPYDEPWGWMQPTRHAYGALLLEQGEVEKAAQVYKADLGVDDALPRALRHPNNVWSLHGYHECLVKLGKSEEARGVRPKLEKALEGADVQVRSSCFCRLSCEV
jgi:tetratricopeptide (TPR) repeat protein